MPGEAGRWWFGLDLNGLGVSSDDGPDDRSMLKALASQAAYEGFCAARGQGDEEPSGGLWVEE